MRKMLLGICLAGMTSACTLEINSSENIQGTWKLLTGTVIHGSDTVESSFDDSQSMIKIINKGYFAFLKHDTNKGRDSLSSFEAGGGRYTISGDKYTEHLEYCSNREWEGHEFSFTISLKGDTLVQSNMEKLGDQGIERKIIEKYVRISPPDND